MIAHLSSYFIKNIILSPKNVERALQYQVIKGGTLDTIICELNYLTLEQLVTHLREAYKNDENYFEESIYKININLFKNTPIEILENYNIIPINITNNNVYVLAKSSLNQNSLNYVENVFKIKPLYHIIPETLFEYFFKILNHREPLIRFLKLFPSNINELIKYEITEEDYLIPINSENKIQTSIRSELNSTILSNQFAEKETNNEIPNKFNDIVYDKSLDFSKLETALKNSTDRDYIIDTVISLLLNQYNLVMFLGKNKNNFKLVKYLTNLREITNFIDFSFETSEASLIENILPKQYYSVLNIKEDAIISDLYKIVCSKVNLHFPESIIILPAFIKQKIIGIFLISSNDELIKLHELMKLSQLLTLALEDYVLSQKKQSERLNNENSKVIERSEVIETTTEIVSTKILSEEKNEKEILLKSDESCQSEVVNNEVNNNLSNIENKISVENNELSETTLTTESKLSDSEQDNNETLILPENNSFQTTEFSKTIETNELKSTEESIKSLQPLIEEIMIIKKESEDVSENKIDIDIKLEQPTNETTEQFNQLSKDYEDEEQPVFKIAKKENFIQQPIITLTSEFEINDSEIINLTADALIVEPVSENTEDNSLSDSENRDVENVNNENLENDNFDVEIDEVSEYSSENSQNTEGNDGFDVEIEIDENAVNENNFQRIPTIELNLSDKEVVITNENIKHYIKNDDISLPEIDINDEIKNFFNILNTSKKNEIFDIIKEGEPNIEKNHLKDEILKIFPGNLWIPLSEYYNVSIPVTQCGPLLYYICDKRHFDCDFLSAFFNDNDIMKKFYSIYMFTYIKSNNIIPELIHKITDKDKKISFIAIKALENNRNFQNYSKVKFKFETSIYSNDKNLVLEWLVAVKLLKDEFFVPILIEGIEIWSKSADKTIKKLIISTLVEISKQNFDDSVKKWQQWWEDNQYKSRKEWILDGLNHKEKDIRISSYIEAKSIFSNLYGYTIDLSRKQISDIVDKIKLNIERKTF